MIWYDRIWFDMILEVQIDFCYNHNIIFLQKNK